MKKIAFFSIFMIVVVALVYQNEVFGFTDKIFLMEQQPEISVEDADMSRLKRDETLSKSPVENIEELIFEADLIADTIMLDKSFVLIPFYEIKDRGKTQTYISELQDTFNLVQNTPIAREILANELAEGLAQNEIIDEFSQKGVSFRLKGCRILWEYNRYTFYLMDADLQGRWSLAGRGDFAYNHIYDKNEIDLSGIEEIDQLTVHEMY